MNGASLRVRDGISLRLKLTLWMLAIAVVIQTMVAAVLLMYQRHVLDALFNDRLSTRAQAAAAAVQESKSELTDADLAALSDKGPRFVWYERCIVTLYDKDGAVIASSVPRPLAVDGAELIRRLKSSASFVGRGTIPSLKPGESVPESGRMAVQRLRRANGDHCILLVAAEDTWFEATMSLSMTAAWIAIPTGVLATGIAGWLVGGLAVAPLRQVSRVALSLAPDSDEPDFEPPSAPPEIAALERDLRETREKLRKAFHAQDRFISNVAHELKTPIAVLLTEAETLPKNDPAAAEKVVNSAREEMERLGRMVESFLTLTKLRGGQNLKDVEPCATNDVVMSSVESCAMMARQHKVSLLPELSELDPPATVAGQATLLKTMVDNLVRNAIRFSPEGETILIRVSETDDECIATVRDGGPGIPPELIENLFDRFVQGDGETRRGNGLGLAIAQAIAELHGGRIAVRSFPEGGCEFTVRLPRVVAAASPG